MAAEAVGYRIIHTDGRVIHGQCQIDFDGDPEEIWPTCKAIVQPALAAQGTENIEHVTVWEGGQYVDMFVDETGALDGRPVNPEATKIYQANVLAHEVPPPDPADLPKIYGDAVLFSRRVWR